MTHTYKVPYDITGPFGEIIKTHFYAIRCSSTDTTRFYDENFEYMFTAEDGKNNILAQMMNCMDSDTLDFEQASEEEISKLR